MIPKIIHYCWFGKGEKNEKIKHCMNSWKKYLGNYKFIEWNEENFDVSSNTYCKEAYESKKWAFVSDYVRLYALYEYGGIYLDTDVEITSSLDEFLYEQAFVSYQSDNSIQTGIIGAQEGNEFIKIVLDNYENKRFILCNGEIDQTTNVDIITKLVVENYKVSLDNKLKKFHDLAIYPKEYFTQKSQGVKNYSIHHFDGSWIDKEEAMRQVRAFNKNYQVSIKWVDCLLDDKCLFNKFFNMKNIAIYGNGYLGRLLKKQADKEKFQINYIIDSNYAGNSYEDIPVIKPEDIINIDLDLIIITPIYNFDTIKESLTELTSAKIISLEELF